MEKTVFKVVTHFYDSGRVTASVSGVGFSGQGLPSNYNYTTIECDVYIDYFKTLAEAEQFAKEAKEA